MQSDEETGKRKYCFDIFRVATKLSTLTQQVVSTQKKKKKKNEAHVDIAILYHHSCCMVWISFELLPFHLSFDWAPVFGWHSICARNEANTEQKLIKKNVRTIDNQCNTCTLFLCINMASLKLVIFLFNLIFKNNRSTFWSSVFIFSANFFADWFYWLIDALFVRKYCIVMQRYWKIKSSIFFFHSHLFEPNFRFS